MYSTFNSHNKNKTFISRNTTETKDYAQDLASRLNKGDVVCLNGYLGAGKTFLVQNIAKYYGIKEQVVSPTFNILLEYHSPKIDIYHFDLYRLNKPEELEDIAFYDTIESGGISFIEWSDKFSNLMPDEAKRIDIKVLDEHSRKMIEY